MEGHALAPDSRSDDHQDAVRRREIAHECHHMLTALSDDRVGDGEEIAVLAESFGDAVGLDIGSVHQHDGMDARAKFGGRPAYHLDGIVRRKAQQLFGGWLGLVALAHQGVPASSALYRWSSARTRW